MSNLNFSSCNCPIHMRVENVVFPYKQPFAYFVLLTIFHFVFSIPILLACPYRFPRPLTMSVALPWALSPSGFFLKCNACIERCYPAEASLVPGRAWQYHIRLYPVIYTPGLGVVCTTALHRWLIFSWWFSITTGCFLQNCYQTIVPPPGSVKFVMLN